MKKEYAVYQTIYNPSRDFYKVTLEEDFTNLKEAKKLFNKIKKDTRGWNYTEGGYLETTIDLYYYDKDKNNYSFEGTIYSYEIKL